MLDLQQHYVCPQIKYMFVAPCNWSSATFPYDGACFEFTYVFNFLKMSSIRLELVHVPPKDEFT